MSGYVIRPMEGAAAGAAVPGLRRRFCARPGFFLAGPGPMASGRLPGATVDRRARPLPMLENLRARGGRANAIAIAWDIKECR